MAADEYRRRASEAHLRGEQGLELSAARREIRTSSRTRRKMGNSDDLKSTSRFRGYGSSPGVVTKNLQNINYLHMIQQRRVSTCTRASAVCDHCVTREARSR